VTTPIVTELPRRLEPITADPFVYAIGTPTARLDECRHSMNYVECDLAVEVTLPRWRHDRAIACRRRRSTLRDRMPGRRHPLAVA
jgi:hypothetical protein